MIYHENFLLYGVSYNKMQKFFQIEQNIIIQVTCIQQNNKTCIYKYNIINII